MVSSKKVHCAHCQKKCSGSVLRYQDQYYHKPCFERQQSELAVEQASKQEQQQQQQPPDKPGRVRGLEREPAAGERPPAQSQCANCKERISDGQALIALDLHWHVWCFKCSQCHTALHGEYVAKDGRAYCEKDYQKLFGITCVYCKRYITGKVLQAGEAHHFHPSCARCSKCGDPFVPGEEMYLQGEVTWHPRCGPGPSGGGASSALSAPQPLPPPGQQENGFEDEPRVRSQQLRPTRANSPSLSSRSRSASPFSYMSRQQYGRASPAFTESEAVGDLSLIYTISYLNADPNQGYLRKPLEPYPPKSPQFSRPSSLVRGSSGLAVGSDRSRCSSRSQQNLYGGARGRSQPRDMYSVLSGMGRSSSRARSPSMMNEEAIQMAAYPSGQRPAPDSVPTIERDDFPAPPLPALSQRQQQQPNPTKRAHQEQDRASRPRSREYAAPAQHERPASLGSSADDEHGREGDEEGEDEEGEDQQLRREEQELSKIANGIGKIFLQTLKEREKLRAWKRANLDPRNASRTPSATRELPSRPLRYDNPTNASPSRDLDRPRLAWDSGQLIGPGDELDEQSPTGTRSSLSRLTASAGPSQSAASSSYGYKVMQASRQTPRPGYGLSGSLTAGARLAPSNTGRATLPNGTSELSFAEQQRVAQARAADLLGRQASQQPQSQHPLYGLGRPLSASASAHHLRRSMPNVANSARDPSLGQHGQLQHLDGPPKLYPYHLLATTNYRLPPDIDRCHLERHLSNEEFQYIFHCDRLDFYRLPEWKRNELKRRAKLF